MTEPLRVMIVDDEAPAREGMRLRLRREPDVMIVGEFADAARALAAIRADPPDLLLLDIEMPGLDGLAMVERLGAAAPAIVFVTAHEQHAVRAFGVHALDYLLKPVEQERLQGALEHARTHLALRRKGELADSMRALVRQAEATDAVATREGGGTPLAGASEGRLSVRVDGVIRFVAVPEVDWIEAAGDAVRVHVGGAVHSVRRSMGEMLAALPAHQFLRIHRSTIVNVARVRELQPWFHGEYLVVLHDGTKLKLSRGYRHAVGGLMGGLG